MNYFKQCLYASVLVSLLSGCASTKPTAPPVTSTVDASQDIVAPQTVGKSIAETLRQRVDPLPGDPAWAPVQPVAEAENYTAATGSLYDPSQNHGLYSRSKMRSIGDIITVTLDEKNQATKSANSKLNKTTAMTMAPMTLGGKNVELGNYNLSYDINNNNDFNGSNATDQSNSLKGAISVQVVEVLPNGNLRIRGEKWLTLNTGDEYIRLSGMVRPEDIDTTNNIASTRISNARIQYSGTGERQDLQEQNILGRYFNIVL